MKETIKQFNAAVNQELTRLARIYHDIVTDDDACCFLAKELKVAWGELQVIRPLLDHYYLDYQIRTLDLSGKEFFFSLDQLLNTDDDDVCCETCEESHNEERYCD